ncbi:hypothetical protein HK101_008885 [Irineochytrium annulatum]|nr:hypothetical protein HK101_008885 [Irineochytrium annulatum]
MEAALNDHETISATIAHIINSKIEPVAYEGRKVPDGRDLWLRRNVKNAGILITRAEIDRFCAIVKVDKAELARMSVVEYAQFKSKNRPSTPDSNEVRRQYNGVVDMLNDHVSQRERDVLVKVGRQGKAHMAAALVAAAHAFAALEAIRHKLSAELDLEDGAAEAAEPEALVNGAVNLLNNLNLNR